MGIYLVPSVPRMKQFNTFFNCLYAQFLLQCVVYIVLGIRPALDVIDIFHRWYKQGPETNNSLLSIGGATICWSIWLTRSKVVFDKYQLKTVLQVLFRGTHWIRHWTLLQLCAMTRKNIFTKCAGSQKRRLCISSLSLDGQTMLELNFKLNVFYVSLSLCNKI